MHNQHQSSFMNKLLSSSARYEVLTALLLELHFLWNDGISTGHYQRINKTPRLSGS